MPMPPAWTRRCRPSCSTGASSDQGHRRNLLQANVTSDNAFQDVGIGIVQTSNSKFGPDGGHPGLRQPEQRPGRAAGRRLLRQPGHQLYGPGEGQGERPDRRHQPRHRRRLHDHRLGDAGGYQMPLPAGRYQVTASVNDKVVQTSRVDIGNQNVKQDFLLNQPWDGRNRQHVINSVTPAPATPAPRAGRSAPAPISAPTPIAAQCPPSRRPRSVPGPPGRPTRSELDRQLATGTDPTIQFPERRVSDPPFLLSKSRMASQQGENLRCMHT